MVQKISTALEIIAQIYLPYLPLFASLLKYRAKNQLGLFGLCLKVVVLGGFENAHLIRVEEEKPSELDMRRQVLVKESKDAAPPLIETPAGWKALFWVLFSGGC